MCCQRLLVKVLRQLHRRGFVVRFDNDTRVIAMFNKMGIEEFGLAIVSSSAAGQRNFTDDWPGCLDTRARTIA